LAPTTTATALGEMTQNNGHYADQGYSRSPLSIPVEIKPVCDFYWSSLFTKMVETHMKRKKYS